MFLKRACVFLAGFVLIVGLTNLSGCAPKSNSPHTADHKITIGLSMDTLKEERWYIDRTDFVSAAKKQNADVITEVAYENSGEQIKQVMEMVSKGIDVLVIIPHDAKSAATAVSYAKANGIKVICYDRLVLNANSDLYISFDNEKVGELQAGALLKIVPKGNYVVIKGPSSDYNTVMINTGIVKVLNPFVKSGKIHIVKQINATDWMADEAYDCINKLLDEDERVNAVIAQNDGLAAGAIDALSEGKMVSSVPVVGMDADLGACQRVVEGQQYMTVYKPIDKLAAAAASFAVKLAKGERIDIPDKISDGKYDIPFYKIEPVAVYKGNMDSTVIKDGFHSTAEVYMNVPKQGWPTAKH